MTTSGLLPRSGVGGVIAVWITGGALAIAIGLAVPSEWRAAWMTVALAVCLVVAFVIQLAVGHADGFLRRVSASVVGAFVVMALIGLGLGLASLFGV